MFFFSERHLATKDKTREEKETSPTQTTLVSLYPFFTAKATEKGRFSRVTSKQHINSKQMKNKMKLASHATNFYFLYFTAVHESKIQNWKTFFRIRNLKISLKLFFLNSIHFHLFDLLMKINTRVMFRFFWFAI